MDLDWNNLSFSYLPTDYNVRCTYKIGQWGNLEVSNSEYIPLHMAATALHYGQEAFEGLKAFRGKDDRIRIFRPEENAKRLQDSAIRSLMAVPSIDLFLKAVDKVVSLNRRFVPPYDSGASLYIRPLLIGTEARVGVKKAKEYLFLIFVTPVGPYFKEGFKTCKVLILRNFDRAAPFGTGAVKLGGNYMAGLFPDKIAFDNNFAAVLYLDAKEKKYIDECGPANFFGIKNNTYITPKSNSILPSITNKSLQQLAKDMGMKVEVRKVKVEELEDFTEVGACGTAAVISPIGKIYDKENNKEYNYGNKPGPISQKLYNKLQAIQYGDKEDSYGWIRFIS